MPRLPVAHSDMPRGCNCSSLALGKTWPSVQRLAPAWRATLTWPEGIPEGEFHREEGRRLVWAAVMIVASRTMYTSAAPDSILCHQKLFVSEPESVSRPFFPRPVSRAPDARGSAG